MNKAVKLTILATIPTILMACSFSHRSSPSSSTSVTVHKLANGKTTAIGYLLPKKEWQCKSVGAQQSYNWGTQKFKGMFKLAGGFDELKDNAIAYVNKHDYDVNYIHIYIPSENTLSGIDLSMNTSKSTANFYKCKHPPKKSGGLF